MKVLSGLLSNKSAATAVEYGLLVALIALVVIIGIALIGTEIGNTFNQAANAM